MSRLRSNQEPVKGMKVYSPSQTLEWSRCPFLWATSYKEGWRWHEVSKRDIAASLGTAFGAGMQCYNDAAREWGWLAALAGEIIEAAKKCALLKLTEEWNGWAKACLDRSLLATCGDVEAQLTQAVEHAILNDPTPPDWKVVAVEQPMPEHGNARADVVYETPAGERVVRDYKFALSVPSKYVDERLADYAVHPQSFHYCWMHEASLFIPTLVIASPRPSLKELPTQRNPKEIEGWLYSQKAKWMEMELMEDGDIPVWKSDVHKTQYGKCELYDYCLTYGADITRLEGIGFVKVERTR